MCRPEAERLRHFEVPLEIDVENLELRTARLEVRPKGNLGQPVILVSTNPGMASFGSYRREEGVKLHSHTK